MISVARSQKAFMLSGFFIFRAAPMIFDIIPSQYSMFAENLSMGSLYPIGRIFYALTIVFVNVFQLRQDKKILQSKFICATI